MDMMQNTYPKPLFLDTATTNATSASDAFDTKLATGAGRVDKVSLLVSAPKAAATNSSATFTTFKVQHSDDDSTWTDLISDTSGTASSSQFVLPVNNSTSLYQQIQINIDTRGRKRYYRTLLTPGASNSPYAVQAVGYRASEAPPALSTPAVRFDY